MEPLEPEDPRRIGSYRLLGRLGAGGMGRVYLARSERGRTVAVKTVQTALAREPDFRSRFAREISIARQVAGRWTAPVLDADTEAATPWLATGYIAGPSLQQVVDEDYGPLPENTVRVLAGGLVEALRDIHGTGLVHRDLKPSNVLITIDGPRVIDFGIARALDTATDGGLTRPGAVIGSPGFMSPEQIRGERVTAASDIFCLGSVLAYALTGRLPFGTADSGGHALMYRIAEEEPDLTGVPESLREAVAACLAKDAAARPGLDEIARRVAPADGANAAGSPWLPARVLAQLGRHAVQLLDSEDSEEPSDRPALPFSPPAPPTVPRQGPAAGIPAGAAAGAPPTAPTGPYPPGPGYGPGPGYVQGHGYGQSYRPGYPSPAPLPHAMGGYGYPPPAGAARQPRQLRGPAGALYCLLGALMLTNLVGVVLYTALLGELSITEYGAWNGERPGDQDWLEIWQGSTDSLLGFQALLMLALIVLWLVWFRRARHNAELFAPGSVGYGRGMAMWSWFIPVGMLFIPKQITDDIWRASAGGRPVARWPAHWWWGFWVVCLVPLHVPYFWGSWDLADTVAEARALVGWNVLFELLYLPTSIFAIVFVRRLTAMQSARLAGRAG